MKGDAFACLPCGLQKNEADRALGEWRMTDRLIPPNDVGRFGWEWPIEACPNCGSLYYEWLSGPWSDRSVLVDGTVYRAPPVDSADVVLIGEPIPLGKLLIRKEG